MRNIFLSYNVNQNFETIQPELYIFDIFYQFLRMAIKIIVLRFILRNNTLNLLI